MPINKVVGFDEFGPAESGLTSFKVGDKVAPFPAQSPGGYPAYGEWAIIPAASVARYPPSSPTSRQSYVCCFVGQ